MPVTGLQYSGQGTNTLNILNPTSNMNGYGYRVILSGACDPVAHLRLGLTDGAGESRDHPATGWCSHLRIWRYHFH